MNARTIAAVLALLSIPAPVLGNEAVPKERGPSVHARPRHPVHPGPSGWAAVFLNDDTWADEGAGIGGGLQWVVVPALGPGALTVGPTLAISSQSDTRIDSPCNRRFEERIVEVTADVRWVVPVSKSVRPFVKGGPGFYSFDTEYRDDGCWETEDSDLDLGLMIGFGAEVTLSESVSLYGAIDVHESEDDWMALNVGLAIPF